MTLKTPSIVAPSLTVEAGAYPPANANRIGRALGSTADLGVLERVGYTWGSVRGGLEIGDRKASLVVQAGMTEMRGRLHRVDELIEDGSVEMESLRFRVLAPTARVGLLFWFKRKNR